MHFLQFGSEEERATFADACGGEARHGGRRPAQRVALMVGEIAGLGAQDTDTVSVPSVAAPYGPLSVGKQTPVLVWRMVECRSASGSATAVRADSWC